MAPGDAFFGSPPRAWEVVPDFDDADDEDAPADARSVVLTAKEARCPRCDARAREASLLAAVLKGDGGLACGVCGYSWSEEPTLVVEDSGSDGGPFEVPYLAPSAWTARLDARLAATGESSLAARRVAADEPALFYNALWWACRLRLPPPFRADGRRHLVVALRQPGGGGATGGGGDGPVVGAAGPPASPDHALSLAAAAARAAFGSLPVFAVVANF